VTGGDLRSLAERGLRGNAWRGSGPLVVEADESDGSLVQHAPAIGVVLNLHRDHMEPAQALDLFAAFAARCRERALISDDPELAPLRPRATTFGFGPEAQWRGSGLVLEPDRSRFVFEGADVVVPAPGAHNARNAIAALAAARAFGLDPRLAAAALLGFQGVCRRFEVVGRPRGVTVVDDFAHNPRKVAAALEAAQRLSSRVLALFQPHGFAPARFMRHELASVLAATLRPGDRFWFAPVFFAGGTVARDVGAADLAAEAGALGAPAEALERREDWLPLLRDLARPGELVLVMGARDPALGAFARAVASSLEAIPL
jgi:UDP-N-acetylmuramate--alanine ligase